MRQQLFFSNWSTRDVPLALQKWTAVRQLDAAGWTADSRRGSLKHQRSAPVLWHGGRVSVPGKDSPDAVLSSYTPSPPPHKNPKSFFLVSFLNALEGWRGLAGKWEGGAHAHAPGNQYPYTDRWEVGRCVWCVNTVVRSDAFWLCSFCDCCGRDCGQRLSDLCF
jgi:hypothetical protein